MSIPKKILFAISGAALVAAGVFAGATLEKRGAALPSPKQEAAIVQHASRNTETHAEGEVKVVRVVDGDTIRVEIGGTEEYVRYIGMDTPETVDPRKPVQCFGVEASQENKALVEGKMVRLEGDITDRDKYHRLLRYVWLGDTLVNETLVAEGFARVYTYPPNVKYERRFVAAEAAARVGARGLWSACPSSTKNYENHR